MRRSRRKRKQNLVYPRYSRGAPINGGPTRRQAA